MRFVSLPKSQRRLTFYSEGKNYWPYLEGLVREILNASDIPVCYISSDVDDPGLLLEHSRYHTFNIDEGFFRNWLFENIETEVMVMTMPDLHQYQVKRSKHKVHYIYVQHSLVSLHRVYRKGAFDYYDTIFCSAPHHVNEIRAIEAYYKLPAKNIVEHGYSKLDAIIQEVITHSNKQLASFMDLKHILIAPSWGPQSIIEAGMGEKIINTLLGLNYKVTLRPHPQTIKYAPLQIKKILKAYKNNPHFFYESNIVSQDSLHDSDIMISDWSGAALDYAFGLKKPVLFIDVPKKINNPEYECINIEPFESKIRTQIGSIIQIDEISQNKMIDTLNHLLEKKSQVPECPVFSLGQSSVIGADFIKNIIN